MAQYSEYTYEMDDYGFDPDGCQHFLQGEGQNPHMGLPLSAEKCKPCSADYAKKSFLHGIMGTEKERGKIPWRTKAVSLLESLKYSIKGCEDGPCQPRSHHRRRFTAPLPRKLLSIASSPSVINTRLVPTQVHLEIHINRNPAISRYISC